MAYKVLGQAAPAASTPSDLYTVPAATETVVSTLVVCNRGLATTFRVSVRPAGAVEAPQHFIAYDSDVLARDSVFLTLGITLAATDVVTVSSLSGDVSFSVFGNEVT